MHENDSCAFAIFRCLAHSIFNSIIPRCRVLSKCFLIYLPCAVLYFSRFSSCVMHSTHCNSLWRVDFSSFFAIAFGRHFFSSHRDNSSVHSFHQGYAFNCYSFNSHWNSFHSFCNSFVLYPHLDASRFTTYIDGKINYLVYAQNAIYTRDKNTKWNGTHQINVSILAYKIIRYKLFITKHYRISSFLISMHLLWFAYACLFPRLFVVFFLWFVSWGVFPSTIFHSLKICVRNTCTMQNIFIYNLIPPLRMKRSSNTK